MSIILKIHQMKKILILALFIAINTSCKAQILPIEKLIDYISQGQGAPEGTTYIKDINNLRDRFTGVWKGSYNNYNYEIRIVKRTRHFILDHDQILIRYKITKMNGEIIEDTSALSDDSPYVISSRYLRKLTYVMTYEGRESKCGQRGELFITPQKTTNYKTMKLFLAPDQDFILQSECPNGSAKQVFPLQQMELTKQ